MHSIRDGIQWQWQWHNNNVKCYECTRHSLYVCVCNSFHFQFYSILCIIAVIKSCWYDKTRSLTHTPLTTRQASATVTATVRKSELKTWLMRVFVYVPTGCAESACVILLIFEAITSSWESCWCLMLSHTLTHTHGWSSACKCHFMAVPNKQNNS